MADAAIKDLDLYIVRAWMPTLDLQGRQGKVGAVRAKGFNGIHTKQVP